MSSMKITYCDGCGKRTDDYEATAGWLHICTSDDEPVDIIEYTGRDVMGVSTKPPPRLKYVQDFCSIECLSVAFNKVRAGEECG